ncbi:hypothetical protein FSARC_10605 [Fusarium sarcochroum]|uniref:DUF6594 domain-containing protein n=1 Tax=Fusarium sarcochroum TaxID=1208366 RepID=A0A8H4X2V8_9HYPO|nr:hypothetical protein FSARC_10605 [Fusarium sarcochroum]
MKTWIGNEQADPKLYVALQPGLEEDDIFTRSVMDLILSPFHHSLGEKLNKGQVIDKETGYVSYDDGSIHKVTSIIVTIIAATLPPLTILALNSLATTDQRIGLTVLFTATFAGILACFSTAKRVEILAATATFAAVEVVFIGSAISGSDQSQITGNLTLLETINESTIAAANLSSKSGLRLERERPGRELARVWWSSR